YSTTTLSNGDAVSCAMTSIGTCATPFIDTSNAIIMIVQPKLAPSVTISADAGPSLFPNEPINFTATATDAGSAPKYQWKRNGANVGGATGSVWGANANFLSDGDEICVVVTSDYACPEPDTALSNCIKLEIRVSVDELGINGGMTLYPNPNKGTFTLEGKLLVGNRVNLEIVNAIGQIVFRENLDSTNGVVTKEITISNAVVGVYLLKINSEGRTETIRFTIYK
ncbi:MAG: T9SS type A sorting domain-containing protein, partial [Taibaiella sp.]|nr:T9SS type A sorting domain-containing protein [Taibaiella sp.]